MAFSFTSEVRRCKVVEDKLRCELLTAPGTQRKVVGITGQLTGSRADLMILDDIEVPGNSMTEFMREKLLQLCTEAESILTPKDDSRIMYLGTPQTTFTIYRKFAERNIARLCGQHGFLVRQQLRRSTCTTAVEDIDTGAHKWDVTDDRFDDDRFDRT